MASNTRSPRKAPLAQRSSTNVTARGPRCSLTGKPLDVARGLPRSGSMSPVAPPPPSAEDSLQSLVISPPPKVFVSARPTAAPLFFVDDEEVAATRRWVQSVNEKVARLLPNDINCFDDTIDTTSPRRAVAVDDSEFGCDSARINVELYRRLLDARALFRDADCTDGELLVARAFDTLLKVRLKRIPPCLLKTNFTRVVDALTPLYPALPDAVRAATRQPLPLALDVSPTLWATIDHAAQLSAVLDVLQKPCDDASFACVAEYADAVHRRVAQMLVEEHVVDQLCDVLRQQAEHRLSCCDVEALWCAVNETLQLLLKCLNDLADVATIVEQSRVVGVVCHGLTGHGATSVGIRRHAAALLRTLSDVPQTRRSVCRIACSFETMWDYVAPALGDADRTVRLETAAAVEQMLSSRGMEQQLGEALMRNARYFVLHVRRLDDAHDIVGRRSVGADMAAPSDTQDRPAAALAIARLLADRRFARSRAYDEFHELVIAAVAARLRTLWRDAAPAAAVIPLVQHLSGCLSVRADYFAHLIDSHESRVAADLQHQFNILHSRVVRGRSVPRATMLYGVYAAPLEKIAAALHRR